MFKFFTAMDPPFFSVEFDSHFLWLCIINYLSTETEVFAGNLRPRPCRIGRTIAMSIRPGRGLKFSRKDRTFEVI